MSAFGLLSKWHGVQVRWRLLRDKVQQWLRRRFSSSSSEEAISSPQEAGAGGSAKVFSTTNQHLVFGVNWVPAQSDQIRAVRDQAGKSGMRSYVVSGGLMGMTSLPAKSKQHPRIVSGALVLSEGASVGGNEIFALELAPDLFVLVALQDSLPVPGFDLIGSQEMVKSAADHFLRLPHRTVVRRCGSRDIIPDAEFFNFQSILEDADYASARLKAFTDYAKLIRRLMVVTVLTGVVIGAYVYIEQRRRAEEEARLARENDPDVLYEKSFAQAQAKLPAFGNANLNLMFETAKNIPLSLGGWVLTQVKCTTELCTAQWSRQYGSYADFSSELPLNVKKVPNYSFLGKAETASTLVTEHPVAAPSAMDSLSHKRQGLPMKSLVQMDFVSQMQDYSLIKLTGSVSAPVLFGGNGDVGAIFRPVLAGEWSASGELWQLEEFEVPDYAVVDGFQITQVDQIAKQSNPAFSLSGRYFVKGKDFK